MITPRPDQFEFIAGIRDAFRHHQSVMGCAATGFGKTVVSAYVAHSALQKGNRVVFSVHRQELISQTAKTFQQFGIPFGYIAAGMPYDRNSHVHIASIDTLRNRLDAIEAPDLFIIDEAHLAMAEGWKKVADHFKSAGTRVLGNSGSPQRLDGRPLSDLFDTIVCGPSVRWLMDEGHLSDYHYFAPSTPDLAGVKKQMGDYAKKQLGAVMDRPKLTGDVVEHYRRIAPGTRAVAFCVNVAHSQHIAQAFNLSGIPAAHIDGGTPRAERRRIIEAFADGAVKVLCNVELITTGFDLSAQVDRDVPVETCILVRPTQSLALHLQMVGRALRRKPDPATIIDHAGNALRHGLPDDEYDWTLAGRVKATSSSPAVPPPVICEGCFHAIRRPLPPACPHCGKRLQAEPKPIAIAEGELRELTERAKAELRQQRKREQAEAKTLEQLVALGRQRGYRSPITWALKVSAGRRRMS